MPELSFTCPKCKQPLEGDDSMRGLVIECPSCRTSITVPTLQKKHIVLAKSGSAGTLKAYVQPSNTKTSAFGIILGLILGLIVGLFIGYAIGTTMSVDRVDGLPFR